MKGKKRGKIHVHVCVPSGDSWKSKFGRSLAMMFAYFSTIQVPDTEGQKLTLSTVESSMLVASRWNLVLKALQKGADYVLFLDSDMVFPVDTLHRLLAAQKNFIAAGYVTRSQENCLPVCVGLDGLKIDCRKHTGVEKIQHAGFGCCLISCDAIKQCTPPLFMMEWLPGMKSYCGEDVYFSQRMAEVGYPLWIDHDLSKEVKHQGSYIYSFDDINEQTLAEHNATLG